MAAYKSQIFLALFTVILKAHTFNLLMFHVVFGCFLVRRLIISSEVVELLHVTTSGLSDMIWPPTLHMHWRFMIPGHCRMPQACT